MTNKLIEFLLDPESKGLILGNNGFRAERPTSTCVGTILETLAEHAPIQSDPHELTAVVRVALGRAITSSEHSRMFHSKPEQPSSEMAAR